MSKINAHAGGTVDSLKSFATLKCPTGQHESPHTQRRLLAYWPGHYKADYQVLVRCGSCGLEYVWYTNEVPAGLQPFHVRIHAVVSEQTPDKSLPEMTEEFQVLAADRQGAYRQAQFSQTMPLAGQFVTTYVDGEEERDTRY